MTHLFSPSTMPRSKYYLTDREDNTDTVAKASRVHICAIPDRLRLFQPKYAHIRGAPVAPTRGSWSLSVDPVGSARGP